VIPLGLACRASLAEYLEPRRSSRSPPQGLDYFTGLFDMDFPFPKYDQIFVPEFPPGAMENPGCVTFTEDCCSAPGSPTHDVRARADGDPARDGAHVVRRPT
jgi:hypothetical protein